MNLNAVIRHYRANFAEHSQREMRAFRDAPTLLEAIRRAAHAEDGRGKRFSHQYRLKKKDLERAEEALVAIASEIESASNFAKLFALLERKLGSKRGLGELYLYDTAFRLGAKLDRLPERVYMHAGTRAGAIALGLDAKERKAIDRFELPLELRGLEMHEVEDILCIYKAHFRGEIDDVEDARACLLDEDEPPERGPRRVTS